MWFDKIIFTWKYFSNDWRVRRKYVYTNNKYYTIYFRDYNINNRTIFQKEKYDNYWKYLFVNNFYYMDNNFWTGNGRRKSK